MNFTLCVVRPVAMFYFVFFLKFLLSIKGVRFAGLFWKTVCSNRYLSWSREQNYFSQRRQLRRAVGGTAAGAGKTALRKSSIFFHPGFVSPKTLILVAIYIRDVTIRRKWRIVDSRFILPFQN